MKQKRLSLYSVNLKYIRNLHHVLDLNNMIPVRQDVIQKIDIQITSKDSLAERNYKNLVKDQLTFCQKNQDIIISKANKLYNMVNKKNASGPLKRRCLKWKELELVLDRFQP